MGGDVTSQVDGSGASEKSALRLPQIRYTATIKQ